MAGKKLAGFLFDPSDASLSGFAGKKDLNTAAAAKADTHIKIGSPEDMEQLSMSQIVALHNAANADAQVKRFKSKSEGIETTYPLLSGIASVAEGTTEEAPAAKGAGKKAAGTGGAKGRTSSYAGKSITKNQKDNPRRSGHGKNAWDLIEDGMTVEAYKAAIVKAGIPGGLKHLVHDAKAGRVTIS